MTIGEMERMIPKMKATYSKACATKNPEKKVKKLDKLERKYMRKVDTDFERRVIADMMAEAYMEAFVAW